MAYDSSPLALTGVGCRLGQDFILILINKGKLRIQSSRAGLARLALSAPRCALFFNRRRFAAADGFVGRRVFGATEAFAIRFDNRARASSRLRSWLRKRLASIRSTP